MRKNKKMLTAILILSILFCIGNVPVYAEEGIDQTFNGCKGTEIKLSISCTENDEFIFKCEDGCDFSSTYRGYSSITIGGFQSYSKGYNLLFNVPGEHIVSVSKNNVFFGRIKVIISENHSFDSGVTEKEPTCGKDGKMKYTCSNCKYEYTEDIPATGNHNWSSWSTTKKQTCTVPGTKQRKCSVCKLTESEEIPAVGSHKWSSWETIKNPTCIGIGKKQRKCSVCQEEETEEMSASGIHRWSGWHKDEDCLNDGEDAKECSVCHEIERTSIPANKNKHSWSPWKKRSRPTALKCGKTVRTCSICNNEEVNETSKLKAKVVLSVKKKTLKNGKSMRLKLKKVTYGDKIYKFSSSNKKVATVNKKGKVVAKKKGKAKITVKMKSGCKATCVLVVK